MFTETAVGCSEKSPWWDLSCDDDVRLREQATMNRAQTSFVDKKLNKYSQHTTNFAVISQFTKQCGYDQRRHTICLIKAEFCLLDLRDAPNCEFEAVRQHVRNMKPYMLTAPHNEDSPNDDSIRASCEQQAKQGGYFLLNLRSCPKEQDPNLDTSLDFGTNLLGLIRSFAETGKDFHLHFDSAKRVAEAAVESAIARCHRTGLVRVWDGTSLYQVVNTIHWKLGKSGAQES